jgi:hypothetical protein
MNSDNQKQFNYNAWQTWYAEYQQTGKREDLVIAKMYRRRYMGKR